MGLIAVVYLAKNNLPFDMNKEGAEEDHRTGAIYFRDPERKKLFPREKRQATRVKLGTSFEIVEITKELGPMLGAAESVLTDHVLYDISHSGDLIETQDLERLDTELHSVEDRLDPRHRSKLAGRFLKDMFQLVKTAKEQKKPIVFV
jgi:hypothetical protein